MPRSMALSPEEQAQRERFEQTYLRSRSPAMLSIERSVCGCDYGATSWTTRAEADEIRALLELRPGLRLLDVGAGSGWPGLYLAETSGCEVALVDLPLAGLRIAAARSIKDRTAGACWFAVADAAVLPFRDNSFDAVSHSDVLCCLRGKRAVLEGCRRVVRSQGRMVFSVISVAPGLTLADHRLAIENGPEFVESETDYPTLLTRTGWTVVDYRDLTQNYAASCRRQLHADERRRDALVSLLGAAQFAERRADWRSKLEALGKGLLRRELFVTTPGQMLR